MADLKRIQHTISKGMKLYCTVEEALEDVIVVSLKHKTKEFRGILIDSSDRHLPPGLCFKEENKAPKEEGEKDSNSTAPPKDVRGVTLDCRYSYNNDPAKYNEQPLPLMPLISIRPARGKQVRNIRLRPRQTLCSKCKAAIHDSKSKSPNKAQKPEGDSQASEVHPHNTRFRAAQAGKPQDQAAAEGPTLRSGVRNRRADSTQVTPKVLLENIRPKRDVKPTAKKKEADAILNSRLENARKKTTSEESGDSFVNSSSSRKKDLDDTRVILERSVSVDNPSALSQYNKQPVVRLDKSAVNAANIRTEPKEEKQEKAPPLVVNMRSTPKITISFGGAGDRDVLKIHPRFPGEEMKSPEGHSTADESPAPSSPPPPQSPPLKKVKKASKRTRDKQRYRIVSDMEASSEVTATGIKIAGHHKKHKRKHRHRHASSEDENFNSDTGLPGSGKLPSLVAKFIVVQPGNVNDLNGNEKRGENDVLKDSSNETPSRQEESSELAVSTSQENSDMLGPEKKQGPSSDFVFDDDPLKLKSLVCSPAGDQIVSKPVSRRSTPAFGTPSSTSVKSAFDKDHEASLDHARSETSDVSASRSDVKSFEMWASPIQDKLEPPDFDDGSPNRIEAPSFQSDDSQDGLIIGPIISSISLGRSPMKDDAVESMDSMSLTPPPPPSQRSDDVKKEESDMDDDDDKSTSPVPYGVGVFEDLTPDEDEGDHDDSNTSQPMYQLPLPKKARMMYGGWASDSFGSSYLQRKAAGYGSSMYSRSRYTNGPSSYYSASGPSTFSNNPSGYGNPQTIQNSPTPMIQKSPMPIFNYHGSRYQSSPNRRFGGSPSRRYDHIGESSSSRHHSVIEGAMRAPSQSSLSRYPRHENELTASRDSQSAREDLSHPATHSRYSSKYDSHTSTIRYQASSEKSSDSRYHSPLESNSAVRLGEDSSSGTKPFRVADSGPALQYVSTAGDAASVPRFAVPLDSSRTTQYPVQGSGSATLPLFSAHPSEGSLSKQYPALGSTDTRFQTHSDSRFPHRAGGSIPSSPSPLAIQTDSRSGPTAASYHSEIDRKSGVLSGSRYETIDTSALFMSHKVDPSSDSAVQNFLGKSVAVSSALSPVGRVPSSETVKTGGLYSAPATGLNAALSYLHQEQAHLLSSGGSSGLAPAASVLFHSQGQGGASSIVRRPSSSNLSQSHPLTVNVSDSDDDLESTDVPGMPAGSLGSGGSGSISQDLNRLPMMKIQAVNLANIRTEDGRDIKVHDVQWGKVQGFPWWPCRVISIRMTHRDHREQDLIITHVCHVSWFGSSTVSDLSPMELRPFREEFLKRYIKKKRGPYQVAVSQAMLATGMTQMPVTDSLRSHPQPSPGLSLMHDLVS